MVKTYSEPLIALEKQIMRTPHGARVVVITAEVDVNKAKKEIKIHFYGKTGDEAADRLNPGMSFTYRGFVTMDGESIKLVGETLTPII